MKRGGLTADAAAKRMALIGTGTQIKAAADADLVVEAVFEDMGLKQQVFKTLDAIAKPGAILATNTSTLDVDQIATFTTRPADVVGMHFFSPANVMRLLEVVRGKATSPETLASAMAVGRKLGKVAVVSGVCDGFIGNRMLAKRTTEAESLMLEGADPVAVDAALIAFGFPMGQFAMYDLAGLDIGWRIRKARGLRAPVSDALCEMGRFGQKTGKGYFLYEPGSRVAKPDPEVSKLIEATSAKLGIKRRQVSTEEILERMIYPMINEAARILDEGIALRPSDIDIVWVYGYGWPAWRGGPMHFADQVGLAKITARLMAYAVATGEKTLAPSPLLARLASEGKGFASLAAGRSAA